MSVPYERTPLWREPDFAHGAREMAAVSLGMAAWGLVTGMAMVNSGLGVPLSVFMSLVVYAGSAQLASLPLLAMGAPLWLIWATALCVNLRFVIFSAQWRPFFKHLSRPQRLWHGYLATDMGYVLFMKRHGGLKDGPDESTRHEVLAYFWGGAVLNWVAWQSASMLGIFLADSIPEHWGIGFAGTLALLALSCSLITDRITAMTAVVAGAAALAAYAWPLRLNIVVAIAAGVALGMVLDHQRKRPDPGDSGAGGGRAPDAQGPSASATTLGRNAR
ncbi:MAG: AzlC family ABC transporter permease [Betaproteobacteria bacterium]|jgi:predicted branched-subunit amino acid permease